MNILSFGDRFPNEQSCRNYLKKKREQQGIRCKHCGSTKRYWLAEDEFWQCANCESRTSLRSGTMMMKSKLPVRTWFMCIHLMTSIKKPISALEMQRQLGVKRYEPVWYMMHKIRLSMGKRDKKYQLDGHVEIDDAFFEVVDLLKEKDVLTTGRGSSKQQKVLVLVESTPNPKQQNPHKKKRIMGFAKMITMDALTVNGITYELKKSLKKSSHIYTDGFHPLVNVGKDFSGHTREVIKTKKAHEKLPWVHATISNAKRQFLGVHHSIGKAYLQNYLNEFCYKLNRRTFETDMFDRMIIAGASDTWF